MSNEQRKGRDPTRPQTTRFGGRAMADHTERVTITDALAWDCVEGECEHYDEDEVGMWDNCPKITIEVCVDCMEERGHGREQRFWEELVSHTDPPEPEPEPEPAIFKPAADVEIRRQDHA